MKLIKHYRLSGKMVGDKRRHRRRQRQFGNRAIACDKEAAEINYHNARNHKR